MFLKLIVGSILNIVVLVVRPPAGTSGSSNDVSLAGGSARAGGDGKVGGTSTPGGSRSIAGGSLGKFIKPGGSLKRSILNMPGGGLQSDASKLKWAFYGAAESSNELARARRATSSGKKSAAQGSQLAESRNPHRHQAISSPSSKSGALSQGQSALGESDSPFNSTKLLNMDLSISSNLFVSQYHNETNKNYSPHFDPPYFGGRLSTAGLPQLHPRPSESRESMSGRYLNSMYRSLWLERPSVSSLLRVQSSLHTQPR